MAYVVQRGQRFTGYYRKGGRRVSAGTWNTHKEALANAMYRESQSLDGVSRASNTLSAYIAEWLPNADVLPITRKGYESVLNRYILPRIGSKRLSGITRKVVRNLLDELKSEGVSPSTLAQVKASLGSAFKPLVESDEIQANPTHGIRLKKPQADFRNVVDIEEFQQILQHLPNEASRLFAKFLVVSGCRFGEATELRVQDFNFKTGEVYVQRRVSDVGKKVSGTDSRFIVVEATKSGQKRSVVLSQKFLTELKVFIADNSLTKDSLVFSLSLVRDSGMVVPESLDKSSFTRGDRVFQHGTLYAYGQGSCRCQLCKEAMRQYRQESRGNQKQSNPTDHLPRDYWRKIWNNAIAKSGIDWTPRTHDLRHANATQLLKNGVDIHEVKERLGHQSIKTTERYLHRIRHQQSSASKVVEGYLE